MSEKAVMVEGNLTSSDEGSEDILRIYEIGYTIIPTVKEEELEKVVGTVRSEIEKAGGNFIAEGAPSATRLAYTIVTRSARGEGAKKSEYDRAYFGWIKFEARSTAVHALELSLKQNANILRSIVFQTVREDTRAKMKAPTLREVRRTDTIKSSPRRAIPTEEKGPVSEEELEKALKDITAE
jgi:ribosomal protein S6